MIPGTLLDYRHEFEAVGTPIETVLQDEHLTWPKRTAGGIKTLWIRCAKCGTTDGVHWAYGVFLSPAQQFLILKKQGGRFIANDPAVDEAELKHAISVVITELDLGTVCPVAKVRAR